MNYRYLTLLLLSIQSVYAATGYGFCSYGKETVPSVQCYGPTKLIDTTIIGTVSVAGPLTADNVSMQSMNVKGIANVSHSEVKSKVEIIGLLNAKNAKFAGDILLTSDQASFKNSSIKGSITVQSEQKPTIELRCKTKVEGNVTFQSSPGVIKKSKDSTIKGEVKNGVVEEITDEIC